MKTMDLLDRLEIYIPVEAEVKSIPLWSLPKSVLRRMGLPQSDSEGSRKLADSPEGIWICPALIQQKGQKPASQTGNGVKENMSLLLGREFRTAVNPLRMSFVSSNRTAYKVLKDTLPGEKVSAHTSHTSPLPQGSAPRTYQDAVVIYHGRIYLSIRKTSRSQSQRETREPQPASQLSSQSSIPSTSGVSSKSKKKRHSPQASLEPADEELQRKRLRVTLPQIPPKQPKDLLTKTDNQSTTDQELLNDNRPKKKLTTCKVTHSENRKGRDASSSSTARSVPQSTDSVHKVDSHRHKEARVEQAAEEAAGPEPAWFQPQGEQEEVANKGSGECEIQDGEEAESTNQNNDMDSNTQIESGVSDNIVGIVEQINNQSWTRRESQGAAASTSLQHKFDFKELEHEERIALMKAKLRQGEAALNNLHSS